MMVLVAVGNPRAIREKDSPPMDEKGKIPIVEASARLDDLLEDLFDVVAEILERCPGCIFGEGADHYEFCRPHGRLAETMFPTYAAYEQWQQARGRPQGDSE